MELQNKKVNALTTRHLQAFALLSVSILPALNFLHLMQPDPIVHRDICCANVLLEPLPGDQWRAKSHRLWICEFTELAANQKSWKSSLLSSRIR